MQPRFNFFPVDWRRHYWKCVRSDAVGRSQCISIIVLAEIDKNFFVQLVPVDIYGRYVRYQSVDFIVKHLPNCSCLFVVISRHRYLDVHAGFTRRFYK